MLVTRMIQGIPIKSHSKQRLWDRQIVQRSSRMLFSDLGARSILDGICISRLRQLSSVRQNHELLASERILPEPWMGPKNVGVRGRRHGNSRWKHHLPASVIESTYYLGVYVLEPCPHVEQAAASRLMTLSIQKSSTSDALPHTWSFE
jgi:hypothetical protein